MENAPISYTIYTGDLAMKDFLKDFLIVGCGLYGATMAERIRAAGCSCMILFGAHIFHTSDPQAWRFAGFNRLTNCSPVSDARNAALAAKVPNVSFGGRLAEYRYCDVHKVISAALERSAPSASAALLSRGAGGRQ
ncbi:MAG TPA: hypothetical protein PLA31_07720 [Clostridia bacterium]|nr:hypothetical protein [Clostridia bacterium]HQO55760.1 hypothetical protein [Clostridia bacterium]HUM61309.1 hypothetical protein [Clostridia bacterium]